MVLREVSRRPLGKDLVACFASELTRERELVLHSGVADRVRTVLTGPVTKTSQEGDPDAHSAICLDDEGLPDVRL